MGEIYFFNFSSNKKEMNAFKINECFSNLNKSKLFRYVAFYFVELHFFSLLDEIWIVLSKETTRFHHPLSDDISNRICLIAEPAAFCMQVCEIFSKGDNF